MNKKETLKVFGEAGCTHADLKAQNVMTRFTISLNGPTSTVSSGLGRRSQIQYSDGVRQWLEQRALEGGARERTRRLEFFLIEEASIHQKRAPVLKIERVPGFRLRDFLGLVSRKKFRELVIDATHAELVEEYQEALANGNVKQAAWLRRTIWIWLVAATVSGAVGALWSKLSVKFVSSSE